MLERLGFTRRSGSNPWLYPLLIVGIGALAYSNSFAGCFLFDDLNFLENEHIRSIPGLRHLLAQPRRALVSFSLALNYAADGARSTFGYHVFNLAVHLLAGLVLYDLVRCTLLREPSTTPWHGAAPGIAVAVSLLWTVHPLQTQSVTYISQRAESMMGLFYLATLYAICRGDEASRGRWPWYAGAVLCCLAGMASKEVMVTAPLLALLYDRIYLAGSWRRLVERRWALHLALAATWTLALPSIFDAIPVAPTGAPTHVTAGFGMRRITPLQYARSEPGVILHYLRLSLWPYPLCLDYDWPIAESLATIAATGLAVVGLLLLTGWALGRHPKLGFLGAWFFVILSPTSSIMPIADLAVEHRMYLPLAGLVLLAVLGALALLGQRNPSAWRPRSAALVALAVAVLGLMTYLRNLDYGSEAAMWQNVVDQRPENGRAQENLAEVLTYLRRYDLAEPHFKLALRYWPYQDTYRVSYAKMLRQCGRYAEAEAELHEALRLAPNSAEAHNTLSAILFEKGRVAEAIVSAEKAVLLEPNNTKARNNLGLYLERAGDSTRAQSYFRDVLAIDPGNIKALNNLGMSLANRDRMTDALPLFEKAALLAPTDPISHYNLGQAFAEVGRQAEAGLVFQRAVGLDPSWPEQAQALARKLAMDPDPSKRNGREALRLARQVAAARGSEDVAILDTLAAAHAELGRFDDAIAASRKALEKAGSADTAAPAERIRHLRHCLRLYENHRTYVPEEPAEKTER